MTSRTLLRRPDFSSLNYSNIEAELDALLEKSRHLLAELEDVVDPDWENLMYIQEEIDNELDLFWSPVSHLNSVLNCDALRAAYNACLPKIREYSTELGQNEKLYGKVRELRNNDNFENLSTAQKKIVDNTLRDFKLGGVSLKDADKKRYTEITLRLSELTTRYSENVLDTTNAWEKLITDESVLSGLPDHAIEAAMHRAQKHDQKGWLLNLEFPTYYAVMTFADSEALRKEMYTAYSTRASDQGPHDKKYDNAPLMNEILELRAEKAALLGFDNYAELSVVPKMVESPKQVLDFLDELGNKSIDAARTDMRELEELARDDYAISSLAAWDVGYYSDKLQKKKYDISEDELKPYFPAAVAIPGMFSVVGKLFALTINKLDNISVWHKDVEYYEILDDSGQLRGEFYLDTYARENKRGGAWMDVCVSRFRLRDGIQIPIAYLVCNLTPPVGEKPALLTHNEVTTLFHEFGHGLHHMLTQVDFAGVSGISGVEWDAVELPSQFLENWCWEREALDLISGHYETGEKIPEALLTKAQAAKNFQSAMQMVRQIELATFDMRIHSKQTRGIQVDIQSVLDEVRKSLSVVPTPSFNRFQNGFSHIFAGGYAAGYFSYKWAEVLSADAFSRFEEEGIFNSEAGLSFMQQILEQGGTREAMVHFVAFRGRKPKIGALLRHSGLAA